MDPAARHGYESYSFHSQYNLLTAAMLAIAWTRADEHVDVAFAPATTSGAIAFALGPAFHKVFVKFRLWHLEIDTGADLPLQPDGHTARAPFGVLPETMSDGVSAAASYQLPVEADPVRWRWARSGETAPARGMRSPITAVKTSRPPSSRSRVDANEAASCS